MSFLIKILVRTCVASSTPNPSTLLTSSAFPSYCWKTVDIAVTLRLTENGAAIQHTAARMTDKLKERGFKSLFLLFYFRHYFADIHGEIYQLNINLMCQCQLASTSDDFASSVICVELAQEANHGY